MKIVVDEIRGMFFLASTLYRSKRTLPGGNAKQVPYLGFVYYGRIRYRLLWSSRRERTTESTEKRYVPALWWSASRARRCPASAASARYACCRRAREVRPGCPCPCRVDTSDEARRPWHCRRKPHVHHHHFPRCDSARCPCLLSCARARARPRSRRADITDGDVRRCRVAAPPPDRSTQRSATRDVSRWRAHTWTRTYARTRVCGTNVNNGRERGGASFALLSTRRHGESLRRNAGECTRRTGPYRDVQQVPPGGRPSRVPRPPRFSCGYPRRRTLHRTPLTALARNNHNAQARESRLPVATRGRPHPRCTRRACASARRAAILRSARYSNANWNILRLIFVTRSYIWSLFKVNQSKTVLES